MDYMNHYQDYEITIDGSLIVGVWPIFGFIRPLDHLARKNYFALNLFSLKNETFLMKN